MRLHTCRRATGERGVQHLHGRGWSQGWARLVRTAEVRMLLALMLRMMFLIVADASATERNSLVKTYDVET